MLRRADLTTWRHDDDFRDDPTPTVVLDPELVVRAVNPSLERATGLDEEQVVSQFVFDAFPPNPGDPTAAEAQAAVAGSFERVLRDGQPHDLVIQRYDVRDPGAPERFVPRTWMPQSRPVRIGGEVAGLVCRAEEIVVPAEVHEAVTPYLAALRDASTCADPTSSGIVEAVRRGLREHAAALRQIEQLQEALTSRATIDQAKGVLMAERRCTPEEAFAVLVKLSNDSNVRLADVARALVYQAQAHP